MNAYICDIQMQKARLHFLTAEKLAAQNFSSLQLTTRIYAPTSANQPPLIP